MSRSLPVVHRFMKVRHGITSFAEVTVAFESGAEPLAVVLDSSYSVDPDEGFVAPSTCPTWFDAAILGAFQVVEELAKRGLAAKTGRVVIASIRGAAVDTLPDAVEVAAALATHQLLLPGAELPQTSSDRPWKIVT